MVKPHVKASPTWELQRGNFTASVALIHSPWGLGGKLGGKLDASVAEFRHSAVVASPYVIVIAILLSNGITRRHFFYLHRDIIKIINTTGIEPEVT
jgi:hypothetical protein